MSKPKLSTTAMDAMESAVDLILDFSDGGLILAPARPGPMMLAAGAHAAGVSVETAAKVYQAMLLAEMTPMGEA